MTRDLYSPLVLYIYKYHLSITLGEISMNNILDNYLFDAFAAASDNIYIYVNDMKQNISRWSKGTVDYFGLESEYIYNAKDMWLEHIHPDDRQIYLDDINAVFSGKSTQHNCQYRAKNKYGKYIWVECRGSVIRDSEGNPAVFAGLMTRIDHQSKYDSLTHLLTGYELIRTPLSESGALMILGIDNFRNINSQHGLVYGNMILLHLSELLTTYAKDSVVYRFRGNEFAIYSNTASVCDMEDLYYKIYSFCRKGKPEDDIHGYSVSAGIVDISSACNNTTEILGRAELCLAHAKEENSSHVCIFSPEIEQKHTRRTMVSEALNKSIENNFKGFNLVYQPILDNSGNKIISCEALLRWSPNDDRIGACYPDEFIPILENTGGIVPVGYFVMKEAIRQASEWRKKYKKFSVSFNVSYLQLQDPDFVPAIIKAVNMYHLDTSSVIVELTESVLAEDTDMVRNSFKLLRQNGIKIALDDFGTGNSSFWTLHNIDIDILKLDQSFIRGLNTGDNCINYAIVESVCLMCNRIGCKTIAEGVEDAEIWKLISKFEFTGLQGYHFSRPVDNASFEELLQKYHMQS